MAETVIEAKRLTAIIMSNCRKDVFMGGSGIYVKPLIFDVRTARLLFVTLY